MIVRIIALVFVFGFVTGCGNSGPKTYPVEGTVTFAKKPLETGTISFEDVSTGTANSASLGKGGKYSIKLPQGSYKVMLLPATVERMSEDGTTVEAMVDEKMFPRKYRSAATSGLSVEVPKSATLDVEMQ